MPQATYAISLSAGGISIQKSIVRTADAPIGREVSLAAGKAGTLTTRTDNDTGIATVASGHGIVDTDTVSVFWSGGRRYGVDVTAVTSTTISIDAGAGDNLPIATTAVVVIKEVQINVAIDGDAAKIFGFSLEYVDPAATAKGHLTFKDAGGDVIAQVDLNPNQPAVHDIEGGATNILTGDPVTVCYATHGDGTNAAILKIVGVEDSTP